jgi:phage-related protein
MIKITEILDKMLIEFQGSDNSEFIMSEANVIKLSEELGVPDSLVIDYKGMVVTAMVGCDEFKIYLR